MKKIVTLLSLFCVTTLLSQDIKGLAIYKTQRKMDFMADDKMSDAMQAQMEAMLKKQFEKEFELHFNAEASVYKEVESLDNGPGVARAGGMEIMVIGDGGANDVLYKNTKEKKYANQLDLFGKLFLVQDTLEDEGWTLVKETKNIGEYTCFKATKIETRTETSISSKKGKEETIEKEVTITAWYTPQIPVKHGPDSYWGLPGLILEVSDGRVSMLCSKLVLNPKKTITITKPRKGKKVNAKEMDVIRAKKEKEMMKKMHSGRATDDDFEIKIRG